MHPNFLVFVALFGYIPFIVGLFIFLPARRAVIYSFLVAWLFLPMYHIPLHGFTDYNKMSAASIGVLISSLIFDPDTLLAFRPKIWDIPMLVWCVCPCIASVNNGLGWYDGIVAIAYQTTSWGLPYFIGRIYFNDLQGLRELAIAIVVGGLVYAPLCWFEIRFSPQLHKLVYGYYQYEFGQSRRYGGFRPMVFMQHGLAVAMWMTTTAATAFWLWRSKTIDRIMGIPTGWAAAILIFTALACHSVGAAFLLVVGIAVLLLTQWTKSRLWIVGLSLLPTVYMVARTTNVWTGQDLVKFIQTRLHDERSSSSLRVRFLSERLLIDRALEQPIYGWAGWDRFRALDAEGNAIGVPDQEWVIAFGHFGLIGLTALTLLITVPMLLLVWKIPVQYWQHPGAAPAAALAILLGLHMCDNLFNAMINPIFILCAGALSGLAFSLHGSQQTLPAPARSRPVPAPMPRMEPVGSRPVTA